MLQNFTPVLLAQRIWNDLEQHFADIAILISGDIS